MQMRLWRYQFQVVGRRKDVAEAPLPGRSREADRDQGGGLHLKLKTITTVWSLIRMNVVCCVLSSFFQVECT